MGGRARAEALRSLQGIVDRLRDLSEPAAGANAEPHVAGSVMASGDSKAGPGRESGSEQAELEQISV
jgi:hypothetical protein